MAKREIRNISLRNNSTIQRKIIDDYYDGDVENDCKARQNIMKKWHIKHRPYTSDGGAND